MCLAGLWACSSPEVESPIDESIPAEPLFILLDAFRSGEQFFLRYRRGEKIYYAAGDLPGQLLLDRSDSGAVYDVPVVTSMGWMCKTGPPCVSSFSVR